MSDHFLATPHRRYQDPKMIGLWKIGRTIGRGASGRVRIARHSKTGQYAAVKIVSKQTLLNSRMSMSEVGDEAERVLQSLEREIVIMKLIEHPNILRLYDVWETSTELYLILEYADGGELFDYLCDKGPLSKTEALGHFQQIMTALHYCHRFNIAHRDLKPENILLDKNKNIKIADFGMAVWQGKSDMLRTACGSPHYAAPEIINGEPYNGTASDVWSCGIILYALLTGRLPFDDEDIIPLLEKVRLGKYMLPPDMDSQAKDLISRMLEKDAKKRITVTDILKHPFYTSQPPNVVPCDIPTLEQLSLPLPSAGDIDQDILANLRTLWRDVPDKQLIDNLTNNKNTWDKAVYHLLVRYRDKHLENYDEDEEKVEERRRARRQQKKTPQRERAADDYPARAAPPTPSRGLRRVAFDLDSPSPSPSPLEAGPSSGFRQLTAVGSEIFIAENMDEHDFEEILSPTPGYEEECSGSQEDKIQYFWNQVADHLTFLNAVGRRRPQGGDQSLPEVPSPPPLTLDLGTPFTVRKGTKDMPADDDTFKDLMNEKGTRPLSIRRRQDKEITPLVGHGPWPERKSSLKSTRTTATENSSMRADRHIHIVEPTSTKLRKKGSIMRPATEADLQSPTSSAYSSRTDGSSYFFSTSPKRNWFGNIFRFGPASYQLLSTQDVSITRRECRKLLETMGVSVMLMQTEGMGTLKCKLPEAKDPAGVMGTVKAVKFRVEMKIPTTVQAIAGYTVAMTVVMEKGANSSFRLVYSRLRREWDLDATPIKCAMGNRPMEVHVEREVEVEGI